MRVERLATCLRNIGITNIKLLSKVRESLKLAIAECEEKDKIIVFGSFYIVAESLEAMNIGDQEI